MVEPITLTLKTPFRIAHGTSVVRHNVLVHLGDSVGEGAIMPYGGYTQAEVVAYLQNLDAAGLLGDNPLALEDMLDRLPPGPAPARSAIDIALHDFWAKQLGYPLYQLWGLNPAQSPLSAITISIPTDEADLRQQVRAVAGFPIIKLKLGTGDVQADEAIVRMARAETNARLCVDANSAWSVDEAAHLIPRLAAYDLLFIEQPLRRGNLEHWQRLRSLLPGHMPPLIADESVQQAGDILALGGGADGVNIKLSKAGGLREARRMITLARTLGMQVMLGCATESAVGITAAAHLAPLVDFADLDGNLNVDNNPYAGVRLEQGKLCLPAGPGLGVTRLG
ncbi:MAG: dipeptide epimerase [Anaerolineae bacterium]|nr:dipeptide epimerase [Anaerolineae bacterium]